MDNAEEIRREADELDAKLRSTPKSEHFFKLIDAIVDIVMHPEYDDEDRSWLVERFGVYLDVSYIHEKYGYPTEYKLTPSPITECAAHCSTAPGWILRAGCRWCC